MLLSTTAIFGVFLVFFALATYTNWVVLAFVISAFLGLGQAFTFPLMNSVLVDSAPIAMRGRIMSLVSLDRAMISLGGAMAGFTIALIGGQPAQIVFGIACTLVSVAMFIFSPPIRRIA